jgi:predicted nuclease with TOPRIM domain
VTQETQFRLDLNEDLKRLIDADPRTNKEVAHAALWKEFGGVRCSAVEMQIEHKERQEEMLESQIQDLRDELTDVRSEREALESKLEDMQTEEEALATAVDELLDKVEAGDLGRLIPVMCEDAAERFGMAPKDVHQRCKRRAAEQDRDLYTTDFMTPQEAQAPGVEAQRISEAWEDGSE